LIKLKPDMAVKNIFHISFNALVDRGIENIIIDLDNTIVPWGDQKIPSELYGWVKAAREKGLKLCILSNSSRERIQYFASRLGILAASKRGKPFLRAFKSALETLDGDHNNTAVVGDQIFTDILGGKRLKLYTILVEPISRREFLGTKAMRLLERIVANRR
jgi:HAD superfamily phosphatase (TIGR01668 family)